MRTALKAAAIAGAVLALAFWGVDRWLRMPPRRRPLARRL